MNKEMYTAFIGILKSELVPALGCTEPGAIAYAAAKAAATLGGFPERMSIKCSGNIIKNVKGVVVPNSGGLRGIEAAAILGAIAGECTTNHKLEVLNHVTKSDLERTKKLLQENFCKCMLQEGESNLYIDIVVNSREHSAQVIVKDSHTNIVLIKKDADILFEKNSAETSTELEEKKNLLNVKDIVAFADIVNVDDVKDILDYQICVNTAIAEEGLTNEYGASVGKTLLESYGDDIKIRAKAKAAAGSDARKFNARSH